MDRKEELIVGDIKAVEFIKNQKKGRKPVCLINGIVGFIDRGYKGDFVEEHSLWHVEIVTINATTLVVDPVQLIKSSFENTRDINADMKKLATSYKPKHQKAKVHYPYKRDQERRK